PGDHPKLRAVSYALALAGFENQKDGHPYDPSKPNPKLYDLLDQLGFSDPESWDTASEDEGHSMGTTIAHKTLPSGQELIVVAPRNYNYMTEWLSNFDTGTTGDHAGFSESANRIVERFDQYIESHNFSSYKVWAVGYSRGGAVIDLFGKTINNDIANYQMNPDDFYVYTFGAPRASTVATNYTNIHDVKDGNDLLLGYVFPELWGFYNTGTYEEIHPADLEITTAMLDITDFADPTRVLNIISPDAKLTEEVGPQNGRAFMDSWLDFVNSNGLTREYFDSEVKPPLSKLMGIYQSRHIDEQSGLIDFIKDTNNGIASHLLAGMFSDLSSIDYDTDPTDIFKKYPPYNDLVAILKGTATNADVEEFITYLTNYIGEYTDYSNPTISETEFTTIKTYLPQLIKALAPLIIADAKYTQETFGENYSLYYTYSLVSNAENLVIGHIPESIMPILTRLIPADQTTEEEIIAVPDSGANTYIEQTEVIISYAETVSGIIITSLFGIYIFIIHPRLVKRSILHLLILIK
ncbi:MAG: hypothetical protein Q4F56_01350, partial [Candidatus Saccharibacteria bacterium]|nr:hypothetical protein [Candidatus Saccharibacteria bacterium]